MIENGIFSSVDWLHAFLLVVIFCMALVNVYVLVTNKTHSTSTPDPVSIQQNAHVLDQSSNQQAAIQLLSLFQKEARLVDFLMQDLTGFDDADIGAAARVVHQGAGKVLKNYFTISAIRQEAEESEVVVPASFDAQQLRLLGQVSGIGPFKGVLLHPGWQTDTVDLPKRSEGFSNRVIAPAEIEV